MAAGLLALATNWQRIGDDPRLIGEIGLVIAAAALVGILTARWLHPSAWARSFGLLAAFAFTALLAFAGYAPAAMIIYLMGAALLIWFILALLSAVDWG